MNIIKELRQEKGLTQRQIATLSDMSAQAVMRYEQGLYEGLSAKLRDTLAELADLDPNLIDYNYEQFREAVQFEARAYVLPPPPIVITADKHPFCHFRETVSKRRNGAASRISFCILLAMHPATVAEYDEGKVIHMPALIHRGLTNAGLSSDYLNQLSAVGELWYERHSGV